MTVEIFCVCDSATKTESGFVLEGVASHFLVPEFPCVLSQVCLFARVRFDLSEEGAHEFRFVSQTADAGHALPDMVVVSYAKQVDENDEYLWCGAVATHKGVSLPTALDVYLQLEIDGILAASTSIYIRDK